MCSRCSTRSNRIEIYHLAGQSSVGLSFDQPVETFMSIGVGTLNLLEAVRFSARRPGSITPPSDCFGDTGGEPATELTLFAPRSLYAVAKAAAHLKWQRLRGPEEALCLQRHSV